MGRPAGDGIFCLEGEWTADLRDKMSVVPILTLLDQLGIARSVHRDVATVDELQHYISKWRQQRYDAYKVLYLAMHGDAGSVHLGRDRLSLDDLQEMLRGACVKKVVYLAACLTLKGDPDRLKEFARVTGCRAVVGYEKEVGWLEAAAFEVLLLERLSTGARSDALFNRLTKEHGVFAGSLGLVVATRRQVRRASA